MQIARYTTPIDPHGRLGAVVGDELIVLDGAWNDAADPLVALLEAGVGALGAAAEASRRAHTRIPLTEVRLLSPVARPPKFLAIGLNYAAHIAESKMTPPAQPVVFNKQSTCVAGPHDPIVKPRESDALDYEGELAYVIGRRCRRVPAARAHEVIAGYLVVNDVSVRDWQLATPTMTMGKSWDTHGPLGPWLTVEPDLDPHDLTLRTWVNDELRQQSSTSDLVHDGRVRP